MAASIPIYRSDGMLNDVVSEHALARLEAVGLIARVIRNRKGHVKRAILVMRPGEEPIRRTVYLGTRYVFRDHLDNGKMCWALRRLGRGDELRPIFLAVVSECMVAA